MSQTVVSRVTSVVSHLILVTSWAASVLVLRVQLGFRDLKAFPDLPQVTRLLSTNDVIETKNAKMHLALFCKLGPSQYHFTMGLKGPVFFFSYREPFLKMAQEQVNSFFF